MPWPVVRRLLRQVHVLDEHVPRVHAIPLARAGAATPASTAEVTRPLVPAAGGHHPIADRTSGTSVENSSKSGPTRAFKLLPNRGDGSITGEPPI